MNYLLLDVETKQAKKKTKQKTIFLSHRLSKAKISNEMEF